MGGPARRGLKKIEKIEKIEKSNNLKKYLKIKESTKSFSRLN